MCMWYIHFLHACLHVFGDVCACVCEHTCLFMPMVVVYVCVHTCVHACGSCGIYVYSCLWWINFMWEFSLPLFMQAESPNQTESLLLELLSLASLLWLPLPTFWRWNYCQPPLVIQHLSEIWGFQFQFVHSSDQWIITPTLESVLKHCAPPYGVFKNQTVSWHK